MSGRQPRHLAPTFDEHWGMVPRWVVLGGTPAEVRLYALLATYADASSHVAFPSRRTMAAQLGVSVDALKAPMAGLQLKGMLQRGMWDERWSYRLTFHNPEGGGTSATPPKTGGGEVTYQGGGTSPTPSLLTDQEQTIEGDKSPSVKVKKPREPNPDWDALVAVFGYDPPPSQKRLFGQWARDLKAMRGESEPEAWLRDAARRYRETYPDAARTAHAVMKHAPQLMAEVSGALSPEQRVADNERWMKERGYA